MHQSPVSTARPAANDRPAFLNQLTCAIGGGIATKQLPYIHLATSFCHNAKRFGGTVCLGADDCLLGRACGRICPTGGADETAKIANKLRIISRDIGFDVAGHCRLIKADAAMLLHAEQTAEPVGDRQRVLRMGSAAAEQHESKRGTQVSDPHFAIPSKFRSRMIARRRAAENNQSFGFAPPSREPSPGTLPALLALALGFAIALALYASFDTATARTAIEAIARRSV